MTAPSIGFKDKLVAASVGVFTNPTATQWNILISKLPAEPDLAIAIFDGGGAAPNPKWLIDYPDVTVIVRGRAYGETYDKMKAVMDTMLGLPAQTVNGDRWCNVTMLAHPAFIGYDEKDRAQFSATFRLIIEPANVSGDNRLGL